MHTYTSPHHRPVLWVARLGPTGSGGRLPITQRQDNPQKLAHLPFLLLPRQRRLPELPKSALGGGQEVLQEALHGPGHQATCTMHHSWTWSPSCCPLPPSCQLYSRCPSSPSPSSGWSGGSWSSTRPAASGPPDICTGTLDYCTSLLY